MIAAAQTPLGEPVHDQFASLLRLRSLPPTLPPGFVHRQRLLDQLTEGTARPVTVLSAGPGYGKTLTLASWYHQGVAPSGAAPSRVAWLAVEETDNDVPAFWSDVLGALTIGDAVPADSALRHIVPAAGFGAHEVLLIRAALADLPHTVVLVLDDIHHITDRRVLESFGQLLEHQPPQLRLVLSTRADPALRLHRMRVNGEVTDIRARRPGVHRIRGRGVVPRQRYPRVGATTRGAARPDRGVGRGAAAGPAVPGSDGHRRRDLPVHRPGTAGRRIPDRRGDRPTPGCRTVSSC